MRIFKNVTCRQQDTFTIHKIHSGAKAYVLAKSKNGVNKVNIKNIKNTVKTREETVGQK